MRKYVVHRSDGGTDARLDRNAYTFAMRVAVTRSGGFAGTRLHVELDSANLPAGEAEQLQKLVEATNFSASRSVAARDAFAYDIVVNDGGRLRTCRTDDSSMTAPTRALVEWLLEHA